MTAYFVGVMSGTSLDGVDAALIDFGSPLPKTMSFCSTAIPAQLRSRLQLLSTPGSDSLDLACESSLELADLYSTTVKALLAQARIVAGQVAAIGCHGQTIRHRPERGFTLQLNDPARVAEATGICVVADFRSRDVAAGGEGAPLAPAFHRAVFHEPAMPRAIVNIGGMSNVSLLDGDNGGIGFDCGPGNVLLDSWISRHRGLDFDQDGTWARQGTLIPELLSRMLADPYLGRHPPKSTGRELFNIHWLDAFKPASYKAEDVQATLVEFTAQAIVDAIAKFGRSTREIYLCGGGALNTTLKDRIAAIAGGRPVMQTDALGVSAQVVEAAAFAWLAMKCIRSEAIDLRTITGARGPRILGAIYPA